jgi:hypothetical protein
MIVVELWRFASVILVTVVLLFVSGSEQSPGS